jgi:protein MpaA
MLAVWLLATTPAVAEMSADDACRRISNKLASVTLGECRQARLSPTGHQSVNNFPILMREFPPLSEKEPRARVLLVGGTHGDELASISIVFKWIKTLNEHHSGLFHWHVVPLMNPDGALIPNQTRGNANGVDLNRNFESAGSAISALDYWETHTYSNPRRYPGPHPLSEPETRWLKQEIERFRPDVIIAVHAPYHLVDFDAPDRANAPENIGYLYKNLMGTYPGSLGNYAGMHLGIPVITLELQHAGIMPGAEEISAIWVDLVRWLIRNT